MPPLDARNIEIDNRFVTDDRLPGFFQRAHVVALPYHAASQSGVAQMAFAFGRPVVATTMRTANASTMGAPTSSPRNTDRRDQSICPSEKSKTRSADALCVSIRWDGEG